ncbi:bifunctional phosphoribosylaminoimidazolecarboxamide formyltransferase/IMP cyclohydrolase [Empedobacter falsenii]|uniref:Bifunctional purine biosynthesis protein PurH n=1 Tax=Empedobacter falsenii TaxID=343874 RepID=A0A7H9DU81_9FLAO|nr:MULTISPECIES: bifunctional phosphoribosylaminoimidazolecarboxamide formyltransferase/IMP cyclohydrolase [Empedobacter]MDH2205943.1 bifunctional phosphoribosylaminoimidazolecarboxamide formyltransferase/IMP cyclohydrolase [Empedobacter sp. GD03644]MDM1063174.1 bifunctional phosphoribosylaminoimidazolecarboxamide formyltransferase/IMP cyclohydrolase [Empedobacter falsenii]MDM1299025.1 bifunctional phosphoribosylaminoimidazolecarboxamide formyltransferase/IMP cyclohydrolase [Empedobacter falseni
MQKQALISVSDKSNLLEFAKFLVEQDYKILSTGGTYKHLQDNGIEVTEVKDVTGFPEILDGRVKSLHPAIHGGIMARRSDENHMATIAEHGINPIDIVIVNLYPFFEKMNTGLSEAEMIEFIDIGGPSMLRSSAKNFYDVTVVTDVNDYEVVMNEIRENGSTSIETRKLCAGKVFNLTSAYDAAISTYILGEDFPQFLESSYEKVMDLRYGENPHQKAAYYVDKTKNGAMKDFEYLQGKELSFNNIRDMDLAYKVVSEFEEITCCAVKHSTPCGVAIGDNVLEAYEKAYECDPMSIFGGIIAFNREVDGKTAVELNKIFLEIVIAPSFTEEALEIFKQKKNLRIIKVKNPVSDKVTYVKVDGGLIVQSTDNQFSTDLKVVTEAQPTDRQMTDLVFAQKIVKWVKSNAIVVATNGQAYGIGGGQTNRIWAAQQAIARAKEKVEEDLVLASDAFFPFRDVADFAAENGIKAIIQPGGSIKDQESIDACNEREIPMVFTGMRHFMH